MNVSIYSVDALANALASHNQRLIDRSVVSCPNNCHCDWGEGVVVVVVVVLKWLFFGYHR